MWFLLTWDHFSCVWEDLESSSLGETVHCDSGINAIGQISCNPFLIPLGEVGAVAGTSEEPQLILLLVHVNAVVIHQGQNELELCATLLQLRREKLGQCRLWISSL